METRASLVKRVKGHGTTCQDVPRRVAMAFEDGKSGRAKALSLVEIADTPSLRRTGLSKRASIGSVDGMYFDCRGPFWMKDVEFPLDLCYLDAGGVVTEKVAMAKDKNGGTLYHASSPRSVSAVELPSGFCRRFGIAVGDRLVPVAVLGDARNAR